MKKALHFLAAIIIALPLISLAVVWSSLPAIVPVHFNLSGEADGFGSRDIVWKIQLLLTVVNAAVYLILCNSYRLDPIKFAASNRGRMQKMAAAIVLFISLIQLWIINSTRNDGALSLNLLLTAIGLLFAIMGNYLYHIRPNNFAGFRVRWTLGNETIWRRTHQLAGRLWFLGGLLMALISILLPAQPTLFLLLITIVLLMLLLPAIYSYRLYKRDNA